MTTVTHCLECGTELHTTEASGLCPKCMLKLGLASQLASGTLPTTARGLRDDGTIVEPFDFGRYRVLRLLGKGGMGAVYEAEDQETQRRVALKVLGHSLDTAEMRARFLREGQIAASVSHPNVVGVFQAHEIEKTPVIAMELVHDGTLRDRVRMKGPLPVGEAVDFTLQIINGLEAAHRSGVLHRDVKPANCFVTPEGIVKVGDFGLSISTLARAEVDLTARGTILGTPAFAAPEQLRGREVDVRADIYAVGATLYYLLTGKPTHEADTLVSLIAAVLEQMPRDPRELRPDLPRALSRFIMRCLAKEPSSRCQTYDELRTTLLPFSSTAATPATLGLRILAGIVDGAVAVVPAIIFLGIYGVLPEENAVLEQTFRSALILAAFWILQVLYYAVPEGLWGASFGKALCGLRVVRTNQGDDLGLWRPVARAVVFCLPPVIEAIIAASIYLPPLFEKNLKEAGVSRTMFLTGALFLVLFVTMRRRNGFAAIHDLVTGTRVVAPPSTQQRSALEMEPAPIPAVGPEQIGPYAVTRLRGELIEAWDAMLRRPVWILSRRPSGESSTMPRHQISRVTRLRWLAGEHNETAAWDAYEALEGMPLTALSDRQQPWSRVRFWLLDLAEEIHLASSDGTLPREIGVQDVWITRSGRAVLLDFPAPDALPGSVANIRSASDASTFLSSIADQACDPKMPLHASEFLDHLRRNRFEDTAIIAANLRALVARPAHFTRQRRLFTMAVPLLLALSTAVLVGMTATKSEKEFDAMWAREFPGRPSLRLALDTYSYNFEKNPAGKQRLVNFIATNYSDVIVDPSFWERPETEEAINPVLRTLATEAAAGKEKFAAEAIPLNDPAIDRSLKNQASFERRMSFLAAPIFLLLQILSSLAFGALWTLFGHAPFALHMAGAVLICADGRPASRLRSFLRSLPLIVITVGLVVCTLVMTLEWSGVLFVALLALSAVALLVGGVMGVRRPERGLLDKIAGTYIVPR